MASRGRPYRRFLFEEFEVLVGRGDAENDELSFRVARPKDTWLHVAGTPGSHVVVRPANPELYGSVSLSKPVLEYAAQLAAWFSKARGAGRVEVHYCLASELRKPKGAPRGLVQLGKYKSLKVKPAPPKEPELDAGAEGAVALS